MCKWENCVFVIRGSWTFKDIVWHFGGEKTLFLTRVGWKAGYYSQIRKWHLLIKLQENKINVFPRKVKLYQNQAVLVSWIFSTQPRWKEKKKINRVNVAPLVPGLCSRHWSWSLCISSMERAWPAEWSSRGAGMVKRNMVVADDAAFRERSKLLTSIERQKWLNSYMQKLLVVHSSWYWQKANQRET